jgi:hypothetical protein
LRDKNEKALYIYIFIYLFSSNHLLAQNESEPFDFPIKPGSEIWRTFTTHKQMEDATKIPDAILNKMSTEDLLTTCLNYPLFVDMIYFDQKQLGYTLVEKRFNGLRELMNRKDAGRVLSSVFSKMEIETLDKNSTTADKFKTAYSYSKILMLLAQESILKKFSKNELSELKIMLKNKYDKMKTRKDIFSNPVFEHCAYLFGKIKIMEEDNNFNQLLANDNKLKSFFNLFTKLDNYQIDNIFSEEGHT